VNLTSIGQVKRLFADHNIHPKKRLGQHFLTDRNVLNRIVDASRAGPDVNVLEIGPGLGVVTRELAERGARVVCVEIDRALQPMLERALSGTSGVEIVIGDFLKLDLPAFLADRATGKWVAVGNLPYYITSPIVAKLLDSKQLFSTILLMVQREVAERLRAEPGTGDYGALSVFVQYHAEVERVMSVSRNVFYPVPEVDSELVALRVRERPPADVVDEGLFFRIVRAAFGKRRKTLLNALSSSSELGWDKDRASQALADAGIDGARRGETLTIGEFASLANSSVCRGEGLG